MDRRFAGLWRHPDFLKLWAGQTVSAFGDQVSLLALPFAAVLALHAGAAQMGFLAAAGRAPVLLVGLFAGVWADRLRRRPLLIGADLGRALLLGSIPAVALLGRLTLPYLYAVAFLVGALAVVFSVAYQAYLPMLVARAELAEGNSKLTATRSIAQIAGPGLAGALVQLLTAPVAILADAASFLVSALSLSAIRKPEPRLRAVREAGSTWGEIGEGLRLVWRNPVLRAAAGSGGTYNCCNAMILALYVLYLARGLALSPALIGVILAALGPGSLLGALVAVRAARRFGQGPTLVGGIAVAGGANLLVPLAGGPLVVVAPVLVAAAFVNGFGQPLYNINQVSLRQAITPDRLQGRMNATMTVVVGGAAPLGALLGGALGAAIGLRPALALGACGTLLSCLWIACSPVLTLREQPEPAEAAA
ncbi:MAG TPA: MFS transporter [Thermomicrobiales bacterium]|nr:MFS transporter [Thermomicrobiales bacterium]